MEFLVWGLRNDHEIPTQICDFGRVNEDTDCHDSFVDW